LSWAARGTSSVRGSWPKVAVGDGALGVELLPCPRLHHRSPMWAGDPCAAGGVRVGVAPGCVRRGGGGRRRRGFGVSVDVTAAVARGRG